MQLKPFINKLNQTLFAGNFLKLLFSYKGAIGRVPYVVTLVLLILLFAFCVVNAVSAVIVLLFAIYCLTAAVQKRARSFNSNGTWYILAMLFFLYSQVLIYDIDATYYPAVKWFRHLANILIIVVNLVLALRPAKSEFNEQKRSFLTRFPIVFALVAFVGIFVMFEVKDRYIPDTNRPAFRLGAAVGEVYRHTYMYPAYCKAHGYEMVNYPAKVREKYKDEIEKAEIDEMILLTKAAKAGATTKHYTDIQDFYENGRWGTQEERFAEVAAFFEPFRKKLITFDVAEEQNIAPDKVKLTEKDYERYSIKDVCKIVDDDAEYFVSIPCNFRYILNYNGEYTACGH